MHFLAYFAVGAPGMDWLDLSSLTTAAMSASSWWWAISDNDHGFWAAFVFVLDILFFPITTFIGKNFFGRMWKLNFS